MAKRSTETADAVDGDAVLETEAMDDVKEEETEFDEEGDNVVDESCVRTALFSAVEGGADGTQQILSCGPLVKLFFVPEPDMIQQGVTMTMREQREALLNSIRSHKFHKGYARRFFAGVTTILTKLIEDEDYVPASAYESDDEDEGNGDPNNDSKRGKSFASSSNNHPTEIVRDDESTEALRFMKACAIAVNAYLEGLSERRSASDPPGKMYNVVDEAFAVGELLHDVLFSVQSCGAEGLQVQASIASFCEKWWHNRFVDRDYMVVQLIPFLVIKSLDGTAQKSDVKRLFLMREAFQLLDFEEETIGYLRSLLLRTVSSPLYLRMVEGRRLIAYLFHLHESLVCDLHKAIRVQIPDAKKTILEAYGDIYFRAWKESEPESRLRSFVEENALQDLMHAILHVPTPAMAKSLHTVLEPFHDGKKTPDVENLLYRLYGPILWRSLLAANPRVRVNAATVLAETFPLQDPSSGHMQLGKFVQKGTVAVKNLLTDSDPRVRAAASEATAKILTTFWDVLPTSDIRVLLNNIVSEHSSDASSSAVRAAAVNAVTTVLEAPQSHAALRALLPSLGNLIHDKVERVRVAVVRMLLRIKKVPGIKYYHVVPVEHLTARLAEEGRSPRNPHGAVPSALTSLMLNSYFPQGENISGADQIKRTLSFLATQPDAASVFYCNLSAHLSVSSVAKLTAMLLRCLSAAVETDKSRITKAKGGKKRRRVYGSQDENSTSDKAVEDSTREGTLTAANTALMASVAETICSLWESIESQLSDPRNETCNEFLLDAFSGAVLTDAHAHFERKAADCDDSTQTGLNTMYECHRTCAAILRCAGRLPPRAVEGLSSHITSKLASLGTDGVGDSDHEHLSPHIALLCLWGMTEDVAKSLSSSIESAFGVGNEDHSYSFDDRVANSNKRKSGTSRRAKRNSELAVPPLPPGVALEVLDDILSGPDPSSIAARSSILQSTTACSAFECALERATVYAERILLADPIIGRTLEEADVALVLRACEAYGRLALHKEALSVSNGPLRLSAQAKTLLTWTTDRVVPALNCSHSGTGTPLKELNISRISASTESPALPCSPSPMPPPRQRANRNKTPTRFDTSFDSIGENDKMAINSVDDSSALLARATAVSLIKSSCFIFSEWLAVGGSGATEVAARAATWCQVLSCPKDNHSVQKELLPAFCRLAVQLCRTSSNFSVLKEIIVNCDELEYAEDNNVVKKTILSLLSSRDATGSSLLDGAVEAVLNAAHKLLHQSEPKPNDSNQLPSTISDVWQGERGCVISSLSALVSHRQAPLILAERLVGHLEKNSEDGSLGIALFEAKCLWVLCERGSYHGANEIANVVRKLDAKRFRNDTKNIIEELLDNIV